MDLRREPERFGRLCCLSLMTPGNDRTRNSPEVFVKSRSAFALFLSYIAGTVVASDQSGGVELRRNHDGPIAKRGSNEHERATNCFCCRQGRVNL